MGIEVSGSTLTDLSPSARDPSPTSIILNSTSKNLGVGAWFLGPTSMDLDTGARALGLALMDSGGVLRSQAWP